MVSRDETLEDDLNLEDNWISEFIEDERKYSKFYKEPLTNISLQSIFINNFREIERITNVPIKLDENNKLSSTTLNKLIIEHKLTNFRLYKILYYNNTQDIEDILNNSLCDSNLLREITTIEDIYFNDTIMFLQSLNTIYFIFVENEDFKLVEKQHIINKPNHFSLNKGTRRKRHNSH